MLGRRPKIWFDTITPEDATLPDMLWSVGDVLGRLVESMDPKPKRIIMRTLRIKSLGFDEGGGLRLRTSVRFVRGNR